MAPSQERVTMLPAQGQLHQDNIFLHQLSLACWYIFWQQPKPGYSDQGPQTSSYHSSGSEELRQSLAKEQTASSSVGPFAFPGLGILNSDLSLV